ncbi:MAG TPA: hypothetical protein VIM70_21955 [Clostridium sp.]|uniref:hypothetical protein n=1 Tax=Clostridium sp. TaxID=1506 RepID=UPI002F95A990
MSKWLKNFITPNHPEIVPDMESCVRDVLNFDKIHDSTINVQDINIGTGNSIDKSINVFIINTPESQLTSDSSITLTEKIKPIEELITSGLTYKAIEAYNKLMYDNFDVGLSVNDKFSIYNGLLNCYVNINEDDEKIKLLIKKVESLGEVKELNKFFFILSVYYHNKQDIQKAIYFNDKALAFKSDYLNAILSRIFLNAINKTIEYKDAIEKITSHPKYISGTIEEIIKMKTVLGDISLQCGEYYEAKKYYEDANALNYTAQRELAIGVSYYFIASINKDETDTIKLNEVDYDALDKAIDIFNKLYNTANIELKKTLYKQLMPFYFSCLHLTQRPKEIIKISSESKEYIDVMNNDLMRVKAIAELSLGNDNQETRRNLSPEEQFKFEIFNLSRKGKYEELIDKLRPFIDDKYKEDKHLQYIFMDSLTRNQDYNEFLVYYKKYISIEPDDEPINMLLVLYYERINEHLKAKNKLMDIVRGSNNAFTILDASRFLDINNYDEELCIVLDKVFNGEYKIGKIDKSEFIKRKFFYLLRQGDLQLLYIFYDSLDKLKLEDVDYCQMTIEYYRLKGDVLNVALQLEELYKLTKNNKYLLRSAGYYFKANDLNKTESLVKFLSTNKLAETSELYMLYSTLEVFHSNLGNAFEYAKRAKEFDKDNSKARSHPFFAGISLRCNRVDDWMATMQGYIVDYPNNGWIKAIKIDEGDISKGKFLEELQKQTGSKIPRDNTIQNAFNNHQIGVSTYIKFSGINIIQIVASKNHKQKLKITSGDITEVQTTTQLVIDEILIDSIGLYILAEAGLLELLDEFKTVYISYTTIECLQLLLSNTENALIRTVFDYFKDSVDVKFVPVDTAILLDFKRVDAYHEETIHCASYSLDNKIPYLNSDFTLKSSLGDKGSYIVNIVAVLRSIQQKDEKRSMIISNANIKLILSKYDFINFNSVDLFNLSLTINSKEEMVEKFKVYLSMDKNSDLLSFVDVYIVFLKTIHSTVTNEVFLDYAMMVVKYIDNYSSKSKYYFNLLAFRYPEFKDSLLALITKNNYISLVIFENFSKIRIEENKLGDILISKEFKRGKDIIIACTRGISSFLQVFGQNDDDYKSYYKFLTEVCVKMDVSIVQQLNVIAKKHNDKL